MLRHLLTMVVLVGLSACSDASPAGDATANGPPAGAPSGTPSPPSSVSDAGAIPPGATTSSDAGTSADGAPSPPPVVDLCPTLKIPKTCHNRTVVYREFGPNAVGDGSYFASQAPDRLGFNRVRDLIWVVKFQTEPNTYVGRVAAYGDNSGGVAYISTDPCDPTSAVANKTAVYGNHGGGSIDFVVANSASDSAALKTTYPYNYMPQLDGGRCYYAVFENTAGFPSGIPDKSFIETATDDCGASNGRNDCYYLAFDFQHTLHAVPSGQLIGGHVIAGFTK